MRWQAKCADAGRVELLKHALLNLPEFALPRRKLRETHLNALANLLATRGISDEDSAIRFLNPSLTNLYSPYLMTGMKAAVDRLDAAIESKEPLLIYGDYDVDGTSAVVVLKTAVELCGGEADFHDAESHQRLGH